MGAAAASSASATTSGAECERTFLQSGEADLHTFEHALREHTLDPGDVDLLMFELHVQRALQACLASSSGCATFGAEVENFM